MHQPKSGTLRVLTWSFGSLLCEYHFGTDQKYPSGNARFATLNCSGVLKQGGPLLVSCEGPSQCAPGDVHSLFSTVNQPLLLFSLKVLEEVWWCPHLLSELKRRRAVPVALIKACFLAKGGTWGFGPALRISFYIKLSLKYRWDCMQRTWAVLEKFLMNLQLLRC